jgi:predicted membrane channel-forming protein YqfA (hemolysin III family)
MNYKSDILAYISSIIMIIGTILPIVIIDGVSKAFIVENGKLVLACAIIGAILYLFKVGFFSFIPAIGSLLILLIFYLGINSNMVALNKLNAGSAKYGVGLYLIIIGSVLMVVSSIFNYLDNRKNKELDEETHSLNIEKTQTLNVENNTYKLNSLEVPDFYNNQKNNDVKENLQEEIKPVDNKVYYKNCKYCGAIIRQEATVCSFCSSKQSDNLL